MVAINKTTLTIVVMGCNEVESDESERDAKDGCQICLLHRHLREHSLTCLKA